MRSDFALKNATPGELEELSRREREGVAGGGGEGEVGGRTPKKHTP